MNYMYLYLCITSTAINAVYGNNVIIVLYPVVLADGKGVLDRILRIIINILYVTYIYIHTHSILYPYRYRTVCGF